jgi:putative PIN family toxin of toxin-antitoxin system
MSKIVLDTNIIISALLSPDGNPAKILSLISVSDDIQLFYSVEILSEYRRVLSYPRLNISEEKKLRAVWLIETFGTLIKPPTSTMLLPDESDRIFYDTAHESGAILVTGNTKHYPVEAFIMTPSDFLDMLATGD